MLLLLPRRWPCLHAAADVIGKMVLLLAACHFSTCCYAGTTEPPHPVMGEAPAGALTAVVATDDAFCDAISSVCTGIMKVASVMSAYMKVAMPKEAVTAVAERAEGAVRQAAGVLAVAVAVVAEVVGVLGGQRRWR